jgi:hypothetical protein
MLQTSFIGLDAVRFITHVIFAASILLFAIGLSRDASVVARRPLGLTAMAALALWPLAAFALSRALMPDAPTNDSGWTIFGYVSLLVPAAAGLVAAAQIARSDTVPSPWRWAPLWVLGAYALAWAVPQIIFVTVRPESIQGFADLLLMLGSLASLSGTLGLGILAIVLAAQQKPESVDIYRSA